MTKSSFDHENLHTAIDAQPEAFKLHTAADAKIAAEARTHVYRNNVICNTEPRGYVIPGGLPGHEIILNNSEGFIALWEKDMMLRWRFREVSMAQFVNPEAAKKTLRGLLADALLAWGAAAPIRFKEDSDVWDFEVAVSATDDERGDGAVMASAFLPDTGRHQFMIYPTLLRLSRQDQLECLAHELGHIFGLRHFFARLEHDAFAPYGIQSQFTIMNYGPNCRLTDADKSDLQRLYQAVWSGALRQINGTPVRLVKPYNTLSRVEHTVTITSIQTSTAPLRAS